MGTAQALLATPREIVSWIINRLHAANNFIKTQQKTKTAYYLCDLLMYKECPEYTIAACSYWGRLSKSGGAKFTNLLDSEKIGTERNNGKIQVVLSSESILNCGSLIDGIMKIVATKPALHKVSKSQPFTRPNN